MKFLLLLCFSVFSLLSSTASWAVTFQQSPDNSKAVQAAAVRYFGFFADANKYAGSRDYSPDTRAMGNVHFINDGFEPKTDAAGNAVLDQWGLQVYVASQGWYDKVDAAARAQPANKSILMIQDLLFESGHVLRSPREIEMYLGSLRDKLAPLKDNIAGVYIFDEPYWINGSATNRGDIDSSLRSAAATAKSYFGAATPVIVTEAAPVLVTGKTISGAIIPDVGTMATRGSHPIGFPANIDWVGVNCYLYYDECPDAPRKDVYDRLARDPTQKMIFTLDGFYHPSRPKTWEQQFQFNEAIKALAWEYPTVAFIAFMYQSAADRVAVESAELSGTRDYFAYLGGTIKGGTFNYGPISVGTPPPPPPQCTVLEPTCEGRDYVRRDSCGAELGRWVNAPPPYCPVQCTALQPTCEGRDWVQRDTCGAVIGQWLNAPPPYCPVQCTVLEPTCEGADYVRRDSCGAELGRWVNAPPPYCPCRVLEPTCEGRDWVRRDSCGTELGRWVNAPPPYCPAQ